MEKWFLAAKKADFKRIGQKFHINPVTARIIRNRDIIGDEQIEQYLHGSLSDLNDAEQLKGSKEAAVLLKEKIEQKKQIRIIGDYDIDGVNATYILYSALKKLGARVDYEIPDRMKDGYGLNQNLIRLAFEEGTDTIVTCDNGITAIEQIAYAKELGMTVIVTDHHEPLFTEEAGEKCWNLPKPDVLIDPKLPDCPYPYKKLCGAAVAWKCMIVLYRVMNRKEEELEEYIPFAAVATVGDVMDLDGENRILVREGLIRLGQVPNPGVQALIRATGLDQARLSSYHIGFVLGPCINASGRLDTAKRSLQLLLAEKEEEACRLAEELKQLNDERKDLTARGVEAAVQQIETTSLKEDKVLVIYLPDCHESIAGIIAGRIRERYSKPVFVLTNGEGCVKGSGRSIESYSMFDEMIKCQDLFLKFGGHPMAAGLSLPLEKVEDFRRRINQLCTLTEEDFFQKIMIDVPMPINYIREDLIEEFQLLEPFGKGNQKPLFAEKNLSLKRALILGKNRNVLKMMVVNQEHTAMTAMFFGNIEEFQSYLQQKFGHTETEKLFQGQENSIKLSVTYYPSINEYMGRKTLQIVIQNYQ
ncbi:MAG: single-stranded-DNA-specific exonuclease RecJ [Lachnospiraceae bacterium]|nr:single-stranded-DNA-specific exonuclease RecJ [Lachnospiraceae bacterium]